MTATRSPDIRDTTLVRDILHAVRYYLRGRRGVFALAAVALVAGLAFGWSWLVAVGIAPLLLTALPCVAMCALGLCMNRMAGRSCSTDTTPQKTPGSSGDDLPSAQAAEIGSDRRVDGVEAAPVRATVIDPELTEERRSTDA